MSNEDVRQKQSQYVRLQIEHHALTQECINGEATVQNLRSSASTSSSLLTSETAHRDELEAVRSEMELSSARTVMEAEELAVSLTDQIATLTALTERALTNIQTRIQSTNQMINIKQQLDESVRMTFHMHMHTRTTW